MNRRTLLYQCAGAGAAATLAGCIADRPGAGGDDAEPEEQPLATDGGNESTDDDSNGDEGNDGDDESDDGDDESDGNATDGGMSSPELVGTDVETHGDADEARDEAEIAFGDESVTVEGTISAPTPNYEAAVKEAEYSEADDEFRVTMTTRERDTDGMSIQPITGKEYTLEATFDGGTPIHVTVRHETPGGETTTVAEGSRR
ncbi:hypothetical protein ACFQDG_13450 [Natronoarchaeum mannanilyticum]|uniref:Uncharacterized protein n=1 Tax=Natronoarchaeum mannanilyticum TaxID=926360 RepID=A0AAV3T5U2_9EURY